MVIFCIYLFFLIYHLCEKCYKPLTAQYNIADCVSYIPRLTFLDLRNKLDLWTHSQNRTHLYVGNLLYTAFHSNLVSEGFRKPDVHQALWVGAGEEQKESLACAQSRPTAKRATVQLKCPLSPCPLPLRLSPLFSLPGLCPTPLPWQTPSRSNIELFTFALVPPCSVLCTSPQWMRSPTWRTTLSNLPRPSSDPFSHSALIT